LPYQIVNVGRVFNEKNREALIQRLNQNEAVGWEFHSMFAATQSGCLGLSRAETLYMVLKSRESGPSQ